MENLKVLSVDNDSIEFEDGVKIHSNHDSDCCESHWLDFSPLSLEDFDGLVFDLSNDNFFNRIEGYGIELLPKNGHPVRIAGYGSNNGYYSDQLDLVLSGPRFEKTFDITACQDVSG